MGRHRLAKQYTTRRRAGGPHYVGQRVLEPRAHEDLRLAFPARGGDRLVAAVQDCVADGLDHFQLLRRERIPEQLVEVMRQPLSVVGFQAHAAVPIFAGRDPVLFRREPDAALALGIAVALGAAGGRYTAKVSGKVQPVRIVEVREVPASKWSRAKTQIAAANEATGKRVTIRSPQRLRRCVGEATP